MPVEKILREAKKLRSVSDNLDTLAYQNAPITNELSILSGSVRNSAALLEVLVTLRLGPHPMSDLEIN
jgi:hypothetical protein